jgi:general secretion pathway protein C
MKPLFKPEYIKTVIVVLILMLIVKLGWFVVEMTLLRAKGVDYMKTSEAKSLYYRTRFASQRLKQKYIVKPKPVSDINTFKLLAIYHSPSRVVATVAKNNKSSVLARGDAIDGYVLDDATATEAIFLRGGQSYRIVLDESVSSLDGEENEVHSGQAEEKQAKESGPEGEISQGDGITVVDRSLLEHYSKNMNEIWKNIGIRELKKDGAITGFKVNFVKRGSDFAKLGLRRGDVIKSINGQELNSYKSAFDIYKNIDTMDNLTMKVMRGKEEMELEYEIN